MSALSTNAEQVAALVELYEQQKKRIALAIETEVSTRVLRTTTNSEIELAMDLIHAIERLTSNERAKEGT